jgi:carboxyl-terminal processing protease
MLDPESKIGYVRITGFQADTADDLKQAVRTLKAQGMRGLVLDLRFNPGGLLSAAVEMCDDFLDSGTIVSTRGRSARAQAQAQTWKADSKTEIPNTMPMIVLVNEYSASASEIFSGAMKDLHRALIIGHRTFGKGSVQNLLDIGNGRRPVNRLPEAMMKLTMQYYYLPNGENLHRRDGKTSWGVDPDIAVDLTPDQLNDLLKQRRDNDIIRPSGGATGASATPAPNKAELNSITVAPNTTVTPNGVVNKNPNEGALNNPPAAVERTNVVVDVTGKPATPSTKPTTEPAEQPAPDTQLETALLMMRLQLVQSR